MQENKNNPLENKNQVQIKKSLWKRLVFWKYLILTLCLLVGSIGAYKWIREKYFSNSETPNPKPKQRKRTERRETERELFSDSESEESELETEPERTLRAMNLQFQRIISDIRNDRISGETINVALRSERERIRIINETEFLLCKVVDCPNSTQSEYCSLTHTCHSPRCENLVVVYTTGPTNYCAEHSSS